MPPLSLITLFAATLSPLLTSASPVPQTNDGSSLPLLIGDLGPPHGPVTNVGTAVYNILLSIDSGQSNFTTPKPSPADCATNPCCAWFDVAQDLTKMFKGRTGRCNDNARAAIRLGFHDAGTWSRSLAAAGQDFGGADGSIILFNEIARHENHGLEDIINKMRTLGLKRNVGFADLIQFAAQHATVTCPLGPRIRFFAGRQDAIQAAPEGLLPDVHAPPADLVKLFLDKTIIPHELTALLGAHSTSKQFFVDPTQAKHSQDTTPGVWDVNFFNDTLQAKAPRGVFRFDSDIKLSTYPDTQLEWHMFVGNQVHWNEDYAKAYTRLSLLGVNNINQLTECTAALPLPQPFFPNKNAPDLDE